MLSFYHSSCLSFLFNYLFLSVFLSVCFSFSKTGFKGLLLEIGRVKVQKKFFIICCFSLTEKTHCESNCSWLPTTYLPLLPIKVVTFYDFFLCFLLQVYMPTSFDKSFAKHEVNKHDVHFSFWDTSGKFFHIHMQASRIAYIVSCRGD